MECKKCKYHYVSKNNFFNLDMCDINHIVNPQACTYITNDNQVETMDICFNCKHWICGGDWGLSCKKDYYNCSANGFDSACDQFERK